MSQDIIHNFIFHNIPPFYLSPYNVILQEKNLGIIRYNIVNAMASISISYKDVGYYSFDCASFIHQELIYFKLNIYQNENNEHILEFVQLNGDSYIFSHILFIISKELQCEIYGSRELNNINDVDLLNINNVTEFINESINNSSPRDLKIQGLKNLAECYRDIAASKDQHIKTIFGVDGIWKDIINRVLTIYSTNDMELNLIIVSTLVEILKVPEIWDNKFISAVYEISNHSIMSDDYHTRHQGIMLYYAIYQLIHDGVQDIIEFSNKVRYMNFTNDKPLIGIIKKILKFNFYD
jgi:hypothetical protein